MPFGIDSTSAWFAARTEAIGGKGPAINSVRDMTGGGHGGPAVQPCLLLLFGNEARPTAAEVRAAMCGAGVGMVSHDPAESQAVVVSSDWLEVLVDGLTFDLLGLAPGRSLIMPEALHCFGLSGASMAGCGAVGIAPGPHFTGAANAMPVVRTLLRLGAALAPQWGECIGAVWHPAGCLIRRDIFVSLIAGWLAGGPFPALGLTAVTERPGRRLGSDGLAFFTGQELVLDAALSVDRPSATRLLTRLVDHVVGRPPLSGEEVVVLDEGSQLRLASRGPLVHVSLR